MIVHTVVVGENTSEPSAVRQHKKIFVGCAESDLRYRDMLVNGRHRWELYSKPTLEFLTFDRNGMAWNQCRPLVEKTIREADGVMMMITAQTSSDPLASWEIHCAVSNCIPVVGVDVGKNPPIPQELEGKMTRFGWEWFAEFFNRL